MKNYCPLDITVRDIQTIEHILYYSGKGSVRMKRGLSKTKRKKIIKELEKKGYVFDPRIMGIYSSI